jgi:hypothetical protein
MFPLKTRKLIRGAAAHVRAGLGIAADYEADYVTLYAPFNGIIQTYPEKTGGNWSRLIRDTNGDKIEFAHLSKYLVKSGQVVEGQPIAITGNTGTITTRPHKHIQIIDKYGRRLDPEKYDWGSSLIEKDMIRRIRYQGTEYIDWNGAEAWGISDPNFAKFLDNAGIPIIDTDIAPKLTHNISFPEWTIEKLK